MDAILCRKFWRAHPEQTVEVLHEVEQAFVSRLVLGQFLWMGRSEILFVGLGVVEQRRRETHGQVALVHLVDLGMLGDGKQKV